MEADETQAANDFWQERLLLGWTRWMWVRLAFLFIVVVGAFGLYQIQHNANETGHNAKVASYNTCLVGNDGRRAISDLIILSISASASGATFDFTIGPTYAKLDPTLQQYLRELNDLLRRPNTTTAQFNDFVNSKLPQRDCTPILRGKESTVITPSTVTPTTSR